MSYFIVPKQAMCILRFYPQLIASFVAAPLPADAEQHRGRAQLDHHLPHAHQPGDAALWQVVRGGGGGRRGRRRGEGERWGANILRALRWPGIGGVRSRAGRTVLDGQSAPRKLLMASVRRWRSSRRFDLSISFMIHSSI